MAPRSDPVADVWRSPELLGCIAPFLDPSHAAWSFIRVNKAAAAAAYGDSGQLVSRTVSLSWALDSGLLTTLAGRIHARAMCYRLTYKQRVKLLCRCAATDCSWESLEGAVVATGLSPPPTEMLVAAASVGRLATCRWLVQGLGCPGRHRLACLCLISAAGLGPGLVEEARAWLAPAARRGWTREQEAVAAGGDVAAVHGMIGSFAAGPKRLWSEALSLAEARRQLEQPPDVRLPWARLADSPEFYRGPHAALAVSRLAEIESASSLRLLRLHCAAEAGHLEAVRFLLSRGARSYGGYAAAGNGHVGVMRTLHDAGCMGDPAACLQTAIVWGHLSVVEWLLRTFKAGALVGSGGPAWIYRSALLSGSLALFKALPGLLNAVAPGWDVSRDCVFRGGWPSPAAAAGCEAAVAWVAAETGLESKTDAYVMAAYHGDLRMVQRLRKLGCPYDARDAEALAEAARRVPAPAAALPWLEEPGCPVSFDAAAAEAKAEVEGHVRGQRRV